MLLKSLIKRYVEPAGAADLVNRLRLLSDGGSASDEDSTSRPVDAGLQHEAAMTIEECRMLVNNASSESNDGGSYSTLLAGMLTYGTEQIIVSQVTPHALRELLLMRIVDGRSRTSIPCDFLRVHLSSIETLPAGVEIFPVFLSREHIAQMHLRRNMMSAVHRVYSYDRSALSPTTQPIGGDELIDVRICLNFFVWL